MSVKPVWYFFVKVTVWTLRNKLSGNVTGQLVLLSISHFGIFIVKSEKSHIKQFTATAIKMADMQNLSASTQVRYTLLIPLLDLSYIKEVNKRSLSTATHTAT